MNRIGAFEYSDNFDSTSHKNDFIIICSYCVKARLVFNDIFYHLNISKYL